MTDPFGWGGLLHIPPPANDQPATELQRIRDVRKLSRIRDEAEAERFRLECERDAKGEDE